MNGKQRAVLILGLIIVAIMGLFPPWQMQLHDGRREATFAKYGMPYDGHEETQYRYFAAEGSGSRMDSALIEFSGDSAETIPDAGNVYIPVMVRYAGSINTGRLLIQILVTLAVTGVLCLLLGKKAAKA